MAEWTKDTVKELKQVFSLFETRDARTAHLWQSILTGPCSPPAVPHSLPTFMLPAEDPSSALAKVPSIPDSIYHRTLESRATHLAPILQSDMFNLKGSVWHFGKYPWSLYDKRIRWHDRHHSFLCYISVNIRLRPAAGQSSFGQSLDTGWKSENGSVQSW